MGKFGCGILMLMLGAVLLIWIAYNLLIARQPEFRASILGFLFLAALLGVGGKWVMEGWGTMQEESRRRRRKKKKKRRRPVDEDEDEDYE